MRGAEKILYLDIQDTMKKVLGWNFMNAKSVIRLYVIVFGAMKWYMDGWPIMEMDAGRCQRHLQPRLEGVLSDEVDASANRTLSFKAVKTPIANKWQCGGSNFERITLF